MSKLAVRFSKPQKQENKNPIHLDSGTVFMYEEDTAERNVWMRCDSGAVCLYPNPGDLAGDARIATWDNDYVLCESELAING